MSRVQLFYGFTVDDVGMEHVTRVDYGWKLLLKRRGYPWGQPLQVGMAGQISNNFNVELTKIINFLESHTR